MRDIPSPTMPFADLGLRIKTPPARREPKNSPACHDRPAEFRPYSVLWARHQSEVAEAQTLRYEVFALEMGARLASREPGLDVDIFDSYCDHLIVRDAMSSRVVGTYRVLHPQQARRLGLLYADSEFDLASLHALRPRMLEAGRACVHPAHRTGAVIMALWSGLGDYVRRHAIETILGCTSVSIADGGHQAARLHAWLKRTHLAPVERRVFPHAPLPMNLEKDDDGSPVEPPPLLKGYLRFGAEVCGPPSYDPAFNVADFLTLLRISNMSPRYASYFLGRGVVSSIG